MDSLTIYDDKAKGGAGREFKMPLADESFVASAAAGLVEWW